MSNSSAWQDRVIEKNAWRETAEELGLNELQILEITSHPRQPWVIDGDKSLVVNLILPELKNNKVVRHRLCAVVSPQHTIVLHDEPFDDAVSERLRVHTHISASSTGVLAIIADVVSERFTPILDAVDEGIDRLEDSMIGKASDDQMRELFHYKKILSDLRRIVLPTMLTLNSLSDGRFAIIDERHVAYLRDSYDYTWRAHELIDTQRDLLSSVLDTYLSVMSNRMNDIMKRLTIVTTIFMPMTFITGFGGMNFLGLPFANDTMLHWTIAAMFVIPLLMVVYFHHKKWF